MLNVVTTPTGTTVSVTDTLTIYAGTWEGAITGHDANGKPCAADALAAVTAAHTVADNSLPGKTRAMPIS